MLKALVIKELRESAGIVAVAALAVLYVLGLLTGVRFLPFTFGFWRVGASIPFVSDGLSPAYALVIGGLSVALGLKQSAWELNQGTYYFLLHRPATRRTIVGTKLVVGGAVVLSVGALLVMLYALWAASPGNSATPFYWSMTIAAWQLWACIVLVYFGAFLSGIRPARWFGTRLVPLVSAAFLAFTVWLNSWWWLWLASFTICTGFLLVSIFYYARRRDY
jgi:hypothetical protein